MSASFRTLPDLLFPFDCADFLRDHWEQQPLHVPSNDRHRFEDLFHRRNLDEVITWTRPRFGDASAFQTTATPPSSYVRGILAGQPAAMPFDPGLADLREAYDRGKSVVIMSMHHRWPAIAALCRALEAAFHCPVHANLYLTPRASQGFAAHYDPHEVFALQLEGVKYWRLYDCVEPFPMTNTVQMPEGSSGNPREVCMNPGDVLYIPRGHVHDAYTKGESSLHLTVGINVYRWADLLHEALARATERDLRLRESIPGGALPTDQTALKGRFRQLLESLAESSRAEALFDQALVSLGTRFFCDLKMLPGNQFSAVDSIPLTADTLLERPPLMICRVLEDERGAAIEFPGNRVTGPHRIAPALRFVAQATRFSARDLPDDLTLDAKISLVRRLVHEGLVAVVAETTEEAVPLPNQRRSAAETATSIDAALLEERSRDAVPRGTKPTARAPAEAGTS